jgi:hypothetical protein
MEITDSPKEKDVHLLDGRIEYLKGDTVEEYLDEVDPAWSTDNWKFNILSAGARYFVDASIRLSLHLKGMHKTSIGTYSGFFTGKEKITNYAATAETMCIKNAASRIGKLFGRKLNERTDLEEPIQSNMSEEDKNKTEEGDIEYKKTKELIIAASYREEAQKILSKSGYSLMPEFKAMVANKKSFSETL